MKRALLAVALLLTVAASPTFAGYIIIRVLLEGGGSAGGDDTAFGSMPGAPPGSYYGKMSGSSLGPKPGGSGLGPPMSGGFPNPFQGGKFGGPTLPGGSTTAPSEIDPSRAVVVVIPLETDHLPKSRLEKGKAWNEKNNPSYYKFTVPFYDRKLHTSLFVDSSSLQLYKELMTQPEPKKTRRTQMRDKYQAWLRGKNDPQLLYDALILALKSGFIRDRIPSLDRSAPKDAMTFAQELLDVAAEKKLTLPSDVERFVKAWGQVSRSVRAPALQSGDAEDWKVRLDATAVRLDGHYALIYWDRESATSEVARRVNQLNDNFAAFYLWHSTRGVVLPVPDQPLLCVLAKDRQAVMQLYTALDGLPMQTDAFYSPDHNLLVLSPERRDNVGQTFLQQMHQVFVKGLDRESLLKGEIPKLDHTGEKGAKPDDVARASTLAVVEKLAINENEVAAVSREGTRQLLFVSGILPRHVTLPNWLTQGALNFFTRPRGPAYVTMGDDDKPYMTVAFTTGYGVPNYVLHRYFRDLDSHKELNANRAKLLENILTDAYFNGLKDGDDPDPAPPTKKKKKPQPPKGGMPMAGGFPMPGGQPPRPGGFPKPGGLGGSALGPPIPGAGGAQIPGGPGDTMSSTQSDSEDPVILLRKKRERLNIKSQATAWALYYYLAHAKPEQLQKYIAELNKLPRDLPIDGKTAFAAFVRVFDLAATPGGKADPDRMAKFAKDWLEDMATVPSLGFDIPLVVPEPPKTNGSGSTPPMPGGGSSPIP